MATTDERLNNLEQQFAVTMTKVDSALAELKEQREDMRRLWERQDAMQAKHDADIDAMQAKHDADMHEMNERFYSKIDDLSKQINDTWKQTMIGVGGMIIALGAWIITAFK